MNTTPDLQQEMQRLARFGANLAEAYSCFIILPNSALVPSDLLTHRPGSVAVRHSLHEQTGEILKVVGYHTLSGNTVPGATLRVGSGLIGWVSEHRKSIHVSPFDHDSRTLGLYSENERLKSFIGVPIPIEVDADGKMVPPAGVIACDSKQSYAFSNVQNKLLHELADQIAVVLRLARFKDDHFKQELGWGEFLSGMGRLEDLMGGDSVRVMRLQVSNQPDLERRLGSEQYIHLMNQFVRLVHQALPPHAPLYRMPNGDIVFGIDNMLTGLTETKIKAISNRLTTPPTQLGCLFRNSRLQRTKGMKLETALEAAIQETAFDENGVINLRATL